ncbi:MAG TPA: ribonuclease domain-containing protein [Chloroflexota bacterium]
MTRNRTRGAKAPVPTRTSGSCGPEAARPSTRNVSPAAALERVRSAPSDAIQAADLLALQRAVGNRAVQGMLARRAPREQSPNLSAAVAESPSTIPAGEGGRITESDGGPLIADLTTHPLAMVPIQRLEFVRTTSGWLGSMIGNADSDAEKWIANFNRIREILDEVDGMVAKAPDSGLKDTFSQLQAFVKEYRDLTISADKRVQVGALITGNLEEAMSLREKAIEADKRRRAEEARLAEEAEKKRLAEEAEKKRLAEEARRAEEARLAEEQRQENREAQFALAGAAKQTATVGSDLIGLKTSMSVTTDPRVTKDKEDQRAAAEKKRLEEEAERKRLAEEAEKQRLAEEAEKKRLAEEAEKKRLAEEAEKKRLAEEAEKKRKVEADAEPVLASLASAEKYGYTKSPEVAELGSQYQTALAAKEWVTASGKLGLLRTQLTAISGLVTDIDARLKAVTDQKKGLRKPVTKDRIAGQLVKHESLSWDDKVKGLSPTEDVDGGVSSLEFDIGQAVTLDAELKAIEASLVKYKDDKILVKYFSDQAKKLLALSWEDQTNSMTDPAVANGVSMFKAELDEADDVKPRFTAVEDGVEGLKDKRAQTYLEEKLKAHATLAWKAQVANLPDLEAGLAQAKDVARRLADLEVGVNELTDNPSGRKNLEDWMLGNHGLTWDEQLRGLTDDRFDNGILKMETRLLGYNKRYAEKLAAEKKKADDERLAKIAAAAEKKRLAEEAAEAAASVGGNGIAIPTVTVASLTGTAQLINPATKVEEAKTEADAVQAVLNCIDSDTKPELTHPNGQKWGRPANTYSNYGGHLTGKSGAGGYKEWYVEKDPADGDYHGSRRLLTRNGTKYVYYTSDHYTTFSRIK